MRAPSRAQEEDPLLVHSPAHVEQVQTGNYSDVDTPYFQNIYEIAMHAVGSAIDSMKSALEGCPSFSLARPPGHHATRDHIMGFCYFNNLAIAVAHALKKVDRVGIVDIDVHHGNGTEDIVLGRKDWKDRVLFCSLHQVPLYPGTGLVTARNAKNYPLAPGTSATSYLETLEQALSQISDFKPQLLAISAGFDTFRKDPLASLNLDIQNYRAIGKMLAGLSIPRFGTLEGGYADELPLCIDMFLKGFREDLSE